MSDTTTDQKPTLELITQEEAKTMPELILDGETRLAKATEYVKNMPAIATDEDDETAKELVNTMSQRMKTFNETRAPFTRKLNEIVKKFTTVENGWQGLIDTVGKKRDAFAKVKLKQARDAQAAIDADLAAKQARIDLEGRYREVLRTIITGMVDRVRATAGKFVNDVTKETLEQTKKDLAREPRWVPEKMDAEYYAVPAWVVDKDHYTEIAKQEFAANSADYITRAKQVLQDSLGIVDVALTDKAQANSLLDLAKQEDLNKVAADTDEALRDLEGQKIIAELDTEAVVKPKVKAEMKIEILDPEAWVQIFANWWKWDTDKGDEAAIERKTMKQMKTFVEKYSNKHQEWIEHPSLTYVEVVKAK